MFRLILLAVLLLAAAGGATYWTLARDDGAEAQPQLIRWVNVTVEVPKDSGLVVTRDFWTPGQTEEGTRPAIIIFEPNRDGPVLAIDAQTGAVLEDTFPRGERGGVDELLNKMVVSALDRDSAPWPYNGEPPNVPRVKEGNITYVPPDPAAGIRIIGGVGDPGGGYIEANNGRTVVFISTSTGDVDWEPAFQAPEDKAAFERFLSTVELVEPE
jgi:hypothetical protein